MKKDIHPDYHVIDVVMTDGTTFKTRSTYKGDKMVLEIDSKSHPFFTGKQVLVDTAGRVDRFNKRFAKTRKMMETRRPASEEAQENESKES